jgi:hypothetical protein
MGASSPSSVGREQPVIKEDTDWSGLRLQTSKGPCPMSAMTAMAAILAIYFTPPP